MSGKDNTNLKDSVLLKKNHDAQIFFLKKLLLTRSLFPQKRNFPATMVRLTKEVRKEYNATQEEAYAKRKYFLDLFNKIKKTGSTSEFEDPLLVIFGGADSSTLKGTQWHCDSLADFDNEEVGPQQMAKTAELFMKGTSPNEPCTFGVSFVFISSL